MTDAPQPDPSAVAEVVSGLAAFADYAVRVAQSARMEVVICTATLDRRIYGDERFVAAIRSFVLQHRRARVRALVLQPGAAMRSGGHRFIELGRSLSSRIEFRQPESEARLPVDEYVLADERAFLIRSMADTLEATYQPAAAPEARQLLRQFNGYWEPALPAREFSTLGI